MLSSLVVLMKMWRLWCWNFVQTKNWIRKLIKSMNGSGYDWRRIDSLFFNYGLEICRLWNSKLWRPCKNFSLEQRLLHNYYIKALYKQKLLYKCIGGRFNLLFHSLVSCQLLWKCCLQIDFAGIAAVWSGYYSRHWDK